MSRRVFISHTKELSRYPTDADSFVSTVRSAVGALPDFYFDEQDFTFYPEPTTPPETCRRRVEECDVYLGLIGFRHGSPLGDDDDDAARSYVEFEFDVAEECGKPRLILLWEPDLIPREDAEGDGFTRQLAFRKRLGGLTYGRFATTAALASLVRDALTKLPPAADGASSETGDIAELEPLQSKRDRLRQLTVDAPTRPDLARAIRDELRRLHSPLPQRRYHRFVGRSSLVTDLIGTLGSSDGPLVVAIEGMGGVGKTALARHCAQLLLESDLFDAVVWESDQPAEFTGVGITTTESVEFDLPSLLDRIATRLGVFESVTANQLCVKEKLVAQTLAEERHLVVVDNIDTVAGYRELVPFLARIAGRSRVLLTTRLRLGDLPVYSPGLLSGLDQAETADLMRAVAEARGGDALAWVERAGDADVARIQAVTGGLPLAVELVVGQLSRLSLDTALAGMGHRGGVVSGDDAAAELYRFIYERTWTQLSDDARLLLILLAEFDPSAGTTRVIAERFARLPGNRFDLALGELVGLCLVRRAFEPDGENLFLHPLTATFAARVGRDV